MKKLTEAEQEIMLKLWQNGSSSIRNLYDSFEEPRPAYNTVSSFLRIMEDKGFVSHTKVANKYIYSPRIKREQYLNLLIEELLEHYFNGNASDLISHLYESGMYDPKRLKKKVGLVINEKTKKKKKKKKKK